MTSNKEYLYWRTNPDWYTPLYDSFDAIIKPDAPERAKRSYEMWKERYGSSEEDDD